MDESELLEILTSITEDVDDLRRELRLKLDSELYVLRKAVNAMLPHVPPEARSQLATEFRTTIAQEAQGTAAALSKTMAILSMPNALLPLFPSPMAEPDEPRGHWRHRLLNR